jgi:hypothetical protein
VRRVLFTMPAKLACDSALGPMDVLIGLPHWCSFVLYETDDQENVRHGPLGFVIVTATRILHSETRSWFERGYSARLNRHSFLRHSSKPHSRVATGLQIVRGHQSLWLGSALLLLRWPMCRESQTAIELTMRTQFISETRTS